MMHKLTKITIISLLLVAALLASGCKVTGGGWVQSSEPDGKANFGFCAAETDGEVPSGKFTYRDKNAGVSISGDIVQARGPFAVGTDLVYSLSGTYRSTNPKSPGSGNWSAIVQDSGEPGIGGDYFAIWIDADPLGPPTNSGFLGGGNIKTHPGEDYCD